MLLMLHTYWDLKTTAKKKNNLGNRKNAKTFENEQQKNQFKLKRTSYTQWQRYTKNPIQVKQMQEKARQTCSPRISCVVLICRLKEKRRKE